MKTRTTEDGRTVIAAPAKKAARKKPGPKPKPKPKVSKAPTPKKPGRPKKSLAWEEALIDLLSEGQKWRYTLHGRLCHAVAVGDEGVCGVAGWAKAAPTPRTAEGQLMTTWYCQRCVGKIVRRAQGG